MRFDKSGNSERTRRRTVSGHVLRIALRNRETMDTPRFFRADPAANAYSAATCGRLVATTIRGRSRFLAPRTEVKPRQLFQTRVMRLK
jgi:hypothetical protein